MNRREVEKLIQKNGVVAIKADKTNDNPEIDQLLVELGNEGKVIPFLAIYPADGSDPITFDGPLRMQTVIDALRRAGPSGGTSGQNSDSLAETALRPEDRLQ